MVGDRHPYSEFGPCTRPTCNYNSPRCEWGYCRICCSQYHPTENELLGSKGTLHQHARAVGAGGFYVVEKGLADKAKVGFAPTPVSEAVTLPAIIVKPKMPEPGKMEPIEGPVWGTFE